MTSTTSHTYYSQDPITRKFEQELDNFARGETVFDNMVSWMLDSEAESFFAIKHALILQRLVLLNEATKQYEREFADDTQVYQAYRAARRENEALQGRLHDWKRESRKSLSHRDRDSNRRQQTHQHQHDYPRSCSRRLLEFKRLWHKALAAGTASAIHVGGAGKFFLTGFNVRFVDLPMLKDYVQQMVQMSPLQSYTLEIVTDDAETRVIGAAVAAERAAKR